MRESNINISQSSRRRIDGTELSRHSVAPIRAKNQACLLRPDSKTPMYNASEKGPISRVQTCVTGRVVMPGMKTVDEPPGCLLTLNPHTQHTGALALLGSGSLHGHHPT
ncbi:hypothetical protein ACOMHN_010830 [Nucella lapillus]